MATRIPGVSNEAMAALGVTGIEDSDQAPAEEGQADDTDGEGSETSEVQTDEVETDSETEESLGFLDKWAQGEDAEVSADSTQTTPKKSEKSPDANPMVEEIKAGGRLIKVDYNDRESIKKAHREAVGMRQFQRERDAEREAHKETKGKYEELKGLWDRLEAAYEENGPEGVLLAITGGKQGLDALLEQRDAKRKFKESASEEQLKALELEEKLAAEQRARRKIEERQAQLDAKLKETEDQAGMAALESLVNPAFYQFSFEGKLGNPDREDIFNRMLWTEAKEAIAKLPDGQINSTNIKAIFRKVATTLGATIEAEAEKKAKAVSETRKAAAKEAVQLDTKRGISASSDQQKFAKDIKSGNIKSALETFLSGKVRL